MHCPYKPTHTEEWLLNKLKRDYKSISYNPYYWWRGYAPKKPSLEPRAKTIDKIANGDFDVASYIYEIDLVLHKLAKAWTQHYPDYGKFLEKHSIDIARLKRLREDCEKDEANKLKQLYGCLMDEFGWSREQCEERLINSNKKTLLSVYKEFR